MAYKEGSTNVGTVTQYDVLVGGASSAIASVGPGSAGQVLQSAGNAANPAYSTATYPLTTTANQILYSSATNVVGGLSLPTNPGQYLEYTGTATAYFNWLQEVRLVDDFIATWGGSQPMHSELAWNETTVSGGVSLLPATLDSGHPGMLQLTTSTSASANVNVALGNNNSSANSFGSFILGGGVMDVYWVIKIPTLSTSTQRFSVCCGLGDTTGANTGTLQANGVYFEYSDNVNSGNWQGVTTNASSVTNVTSATAATTAWTTLHININAGATTITFYLNGVSIGTSATNIPTGNISPFIQIGKSVGTTNRTLDADLFYLYQYLTSAR